MMLFARKSMTDWVEEARLNGGLLIDVRTPEEYASGHIPGSANLPLGRMEEIEAIASSRTAPLYVYCLSGGRSAQACALLNRMGYKQVHNIGGIMSWRSEIVKGESA